MTDKYLFPWSMLREDVSAILHTNAPCLLNKLLISLNELQSQSRTRQQKGVIHGNLIPSKVLLNGEMAPLIIGFGQYSSLEPDTSLFPPSRGSRARTGLLAPEQVSETRQEWKTRWLTSMPSVESCICY